VALPLKRTPVSQNRRSVIARLARSRPGKREQPQRIRAAGPSRIPRSVASRSVTANGREPLVAFFSIFALHCDTVAERSGVRTIHFSLNGHCVEGIGSEPQFLFSATGFAVVTFNHVNPASSEAQSVLISLEIPWRFRSYSIAWTDGDRADDLAVKSEVGPVALERRRRTKSAQHPRPRILIQNGGKVRVLDTVVAYKKTDSRSAFVMNRPPGKAADYLTWGRSRSLAGIGRTLPVDVDRDPPSVMIWPSSPFRAEVFVDLGTRRSASVRRFVPRSSWNYQCG